MLIAYGAMTVSMLAIDYVWLTTMSKRFYAVHLSPILSATPNMLAAGIFYLIYTFGLFLFVIRPALLANMPLGRVALWGALFGLVAYATYDLTNQATLKDWRVIVTVVDLAWGMVLTGTVSMVAVWCARLFS